MKSSHLSLETFKIAKLNDPQKVRGGGGDTFKPKCIKTSREYVMMYQEDEISHN
ncbi:hypothetical protein [Aquimarina celericrescens]|uniref:Bacteriocin n=1 Tax=Aquimarina celericrescens TaxID=1964542 RepID=A0ABW5AT09_9FLAO|nr:hypothetical protein [Aquimarina celericrescens]